MDHELIKPEQITINDLDGNELVFNISRIPAIAAREIITQYPTTALPRIGDYDSNEVMMLKLMKYVDIVKDGEPTRLKTKALIDNNIPDGETLMRLEAAMLNYNTNFLKIGRISKSLNGFAANIEQLITRTLTSLSASSSQKNKPRSKSSGKK